MYKPLSTLAEKDCGKTITVKGWIRSVRDQKQLVFINIYDGSNMAGLQIIADTAKNSDLQKSIQHLSVGTAVAITGTLVKSPGKEQPVELQATAITIIGLCPAEDYPLQKKRHSFEFLRTIAHLRPRTNTFGAVARVRNALSYATHKFFQENGFLYIMAPIITASDCEGAGQMFQVTTLKLNELPKTTTGAVDFTQDFFAKPAFLTVSGQLNLETSCCALGNVYTFGPTFRAENSNTSRHLAEFWMIEPELAFADINDDMDVAESYLKYVLGHVLSTCAADLKFFNEFIDKTVLERLNNVVSQPFERITYTQAIEILKKAPKKFEYPVSWGCDLQSEHERYLTEEHFKRPTIVTGYPKEIKAFYMRQNEDGKTVAAMDILVPGIGELVGGSQREERLDVLEKRLEEFKLNKHDYWWYLELRKYGSMPHAGFGVGFERLVQFATGMENIRDVIPFPRYPGHADF
jgi:asparaginyl-tRNA synthetase